MENKLRDSIKYHKKDYEDQKKKLDSEMIKMLNDKGTSSKEKVYWSGIVNRLNEAISKGDSDDVKKLLSELQNKNN